MINPFISLFTKKSKFLQPKIQKTAMIDNIISYHNRLFNTDFYFLIKSSELLGNHGFIVKFGIIVSD